MNAHEKKMHKRAYAHSGYQYAKLVALALLYGAALGGIVIFSVFAVNGFDCNDPWGRN